MCASLRQTPLLALALLAWSFAPANDAPEKAPAPRRTFLGVHVCPVPPEVRAQTDLEEGAGLLIDFIQPKSPAELAGILQFDILLKVGDQRVLNQDQFGSLIRAASSGQEVSLSVLRRGKEQAIKATLGDAPAIPDGLPGRQQKSAVDQWLLEMAKKDPKIRQLIDKGLLLLPGQKEAQDNKGNVVATQSHSICRKDSEGVVEISIRDNESVAKVKDAAGKVIFEGPINTKEQRDAIDPAIRTRIENAEKSAQSLGGSP